MRKILSIKEMEDLLMEKSSIDDLNVGLPDSHNPKNKISAQEVQQDISVLARIFIRIYVGWPVHNDIIKRKVLNSLLKIYNNAHDMTNQEFFDLLKPIMPYFPDEHISIAFNKERVGTKPRKTTKDVGMNIADTKPIVTDITKDNIAIIAFSAMLKTDEFQNTILDFEQNILPKSKALIIDLRNNGGGNSMYSDRFAKYLCGTNIDNAKETYVRTTPEAVYAQQKCYPNASWANLPRGEKMVLWKSGKVFKINKKQAYMKPIYILTNWRTGSSAEMFLLRMLHHPMITVIGDNSGGMETFGNMTRLHLPHSKITVSVGMNYRVLEYDNFESHGVTPNIKCRNGTNAFDIALKQIKQR